VTLARTYVPKSRFCPCRQGSEDRRLPTGLKMRGIAMERHMGRGRRLPTRVERRVIARGSQLRKAGSRPIRVDGWAIVRS